MTKEQLEKLAKQSAKERALRKEKSLDEAIANAKKLDEERARRRKENKVSKEEKVLNTIAAMLHYSDSKQKESIKKVISKKKDEWDVKIGDPIEYFDPDLSYELTGYRPITATEGLDFDPKLFTKAADNYKHTGRYTQFVPGTFAHRAFWEEEFRRCRDGYTVGRYTLTGDNYFWLNYYRMLSAIRELGQLEKRIENFPGFINKQYEYFHYLELCRKLEMDGVVFKGRAVGCSEIASSVCASQYTFHKASRHVITAFSDTYVTRTLNKVWLELDFLNSLTEGGFKHLRLKINTSYYKRASKVDKNGNESGWKAEIEGIVADSPKKLRGDRTSTVFFEESGQNVCLIDTYTQGEALVAFGGIRSGSRFVFGTSDSSGPALAGLKEMFLNPTKYSALPYKNKYMRDGSIQYTGYFIPSFSVFYSDKLGEDFFKRGVVNEEVSKAFYNAEFDKVKDDKKLLLRKRAEFCFTPEDGFILEGSDVFNTEKLTELLINILQLKQVPEPRRIRLSWDYNKELGGVDRNSMPKAEFTDQGKILITELPMTDDHGIPFNNLYVIGIDAIDQDKTTSTGQTDVSKFCIVVMRRLVGLKPPKIVALYLERPNDVREAFDNALKLCLFYNAKALVEATKIGVITHFKNYGKQSYLMKRPSATITSGKQNKTQYGIPAPTSVIEHLIELILEYVEDFYDQIDYLDVIDQLLRYSFENKRKFDIVAALGVCLLANEDMLGKVPKIDNSGGKKLLNVGYYKNEYGLIVYGVIKQTEQSTMRYGWFRETN